MFLAATISAAGIFATPATTHGLVQLLTGLMRQHAKLTQKHNDSISKLLAAMSTTADVPLTFGTFLPICEALLNAAKSKHTTKSS